MIPEIKPDTSLSKGAVSGREWATLDPSQARSLLGLSNDCPDEMVVLIAEDYCDAEARRKALVNVDDRLRFRMDKWGTGTVVSSQSTNSVVPLWGFDRPPGMKWAIEGFAPDGFVTLLAADGGIGKSFLALHLSVCVALGRPFLGLPVERRRVLYVDYELDANVHKNRLYRVLEGMGMTPDEKGLKEHFYYVRPENNLPKGAGEVAEIVNRLNIGLVVLDSLTLASIGDVMDAQDTTELMRAFREWGTVLALDHVSGASARGNAANARPFGSVFKRNLARATFALAKAEGGGLLLRADKSNFAAGGDLLCFDVVFDGANGPVEFRRLDATADEMVGVHLHMKPQEITLYAIKDLYADVKRGCAPVQPEEVSQWLDDHDMPPKKTGTIRNHMTGLVRRNLLERAPHGGFIPFHDSIHDAIFDRSKNGLNEPETPFHDSRPLRESGIVNGLPEKSDSSAVLSRIRREIDMQPKYGEAA